MSVWFDDSGSISGTHKRIDEVDRQILIALQQDGRISNKNLAIAMGLSPSTCLERVRRLERAGIILGYHARVAMYHTAVRFEVWATIRFLDLPVTTQKMLHDLISSSVHIVAVVQMTGSFDCLIHFVCEEAAPWRLFCGELSSIGVQADRLSFGVATDHLALEGR